MSNHEIQIKVDRSYRIIEDGIARLSMEVVATTNHLSPNKRLVAKGLSFEMQNPKIELKDGVEIDLSDALISGITSSWGNDSFEFGIRHGNPVWIFPQFPLGEKVVLSATYVDENIVLDIK